MFPKQNLTAFPLIIPSQKVRICWNSKNGDAIIAKKAQEIYCF